MPIVSIRKAVAVLTVSAGIALTPSVYAETLKIQTSFNASHISLTRLNQIWIPKLKEMTNGAVELELLPIGSVVAHKETPVAVSMGILDGDLTATSYFAGKDPAFALMGDLIAGYDNPSQIQDFCMNGGGKELLQKLYDKYDPGVHVIGCSSEKREAFVSKVPLRSVADLKGLKVRSPEGLAADVFRRAGAAPVSLPGSEVYTALEKNVIDAADSSAYANNDASGMHKVAKFPIYPGIHSMPFMQFTITDSKWESLSKANQQALTTWFTSAYDDLRVYLDAKDKELVARDKKAGDITVIDWSQAERDKFRKIAQTAWSAFAAASPLAQEVYDAHVAYMKSHGLL
ncbi:C4-dicarboxylate ABC transporter substrate-binding protein [Marinomonas sp. CT5]|uniref:TRAP transporter substrate-binding protein n=1 Tax=Marinomonas sp. CT5 TaxID=2066133 RepID=UPI001BAFE1CB|nr:TRAP transporter substrate-binding protein [Marinomonas sp. CT5]QUX94308.1 C4-dicarboxylate ABC transporter substrate-binding protein [Marinomonas sp. CT5]